MTNSISVNMHVVEDEASLDAFNTNMGIASTKESAMALFDVDGWTAEDATESEVQISRVYKTRAEIEKIFSTEIEEGDCYISQVYGGYILTANVWVVTTTENE